jgi:hypothetical protein
MTTVLEQRRAARKRTNLVTDEELGFVAATMHLSRAEVAAELGRSEGMIGNMRTMVRTGRIPATVSGASRRWTSEEDELLLSLRDHKLRRSALEGMFPGRSYDSIRARRQELGVSVGKWATSDDAHCRDRSAGTPKVRAWDAAEIQFIIENPQMTARQMVEHLPGRSYAAIKKRRQEMGAATKKNSFTVSPFSVHGRPLLAKTCTKCGRLLPAKWFRFESRTGGRWSSACRECASSENRLWRESTDDPTRASRSGNRERQRLSLPTATRRGDEWTSEEMTILADPTLTTLQKAIRTHRTYYGTACALAAFGFASAIEALGSTEEDKWHIDNPNSERIDEIKMAAEGQGKGE